MERSRSPLLVEASLYSGNRYDRRALRILDTLGSMRLLSECWTLLPRVRVCPPHHGVDSVVKSAAPLPGKAFAQDLFDPVYVSGFAATHFREPTLDDLRKLSPNDLRFAERFGIAVVELKQVSLKYIPCASRLPPPEPIETWKNLCLCGEYPVTLLEEYLGSAAFSEESV